MMHVLRFPTPSPSVMIVTSCIIGFMIFHVASSSTNITQSCPCTPHSLCLPIKDTSRKEIFAFSLKNDLTRWMMYDWTKLTTVVMVGYVNTTLMCLAHSHNVRVSYIAGTAVANFTDPSSRQAWIKYHMDIVETNFLDGLNFDFENSIDEKDETTRDDYTSLVAETNSAFKERHPYFQVTVDVPWKPNTDARFYDLPGLAKSSDFLFVMSYDEQSQIFGECVAGPNSGFDRTFDGLQYYFLEHIKPEKLVLGVPWYGYIYPCLRIQENLCYLKHVPFRGVNCSDAAGKEYNYASIYALMELHEASGSWNSSSQTPFFTFQDNNKTWHQIQYDDPKSLSMKYRRAVEMGLRGVGMWNIDALDYSNTADGKFIRETMFGELPLYS